ncbi:MAG: epoxide hydrolase N-terminal domain-containing protein [Ilumatobacteraceae bacterium]
MCRYWADEYDWPAREAALNRFDQFVAGIDGVEIHVHQRSSNPDAIPLLITHGWPGSIVEFHKVIEHHSRPPGRTRGRPCRCST